jgi:hypothetical protein
MTTLGPNDVDILMPASQRRRAAWTAIGSGVIGIVAFFFLIAALVTRDLLVDPAPALESGRAPHGPWDVLFRGQDVGVMVQALLMIPVTLFVHDLGRQRSQGLSGVNVALGLVGHSAVALAVLLVFAYRAFWADGLYMFPLGVVGMWLIGVSWLITGRVSRGVTGAGIGAGLGLVLIGAGAIGIAIGLGPEIFNLKEPAALDPARVSGTANRVAHAALPVGTLMGRGLYPIWAILLGRRLLRE